ncbi:MAG: SGNH/GDSL hydrolase family protein [Anaerolineae bacterium]|jgi:lysophospholipase L1-like esterase|nr:SGNH/GDSL hydrolase family protein [Anaerolineae bacterium]MBT7071556.1 SGNH/GDSL hydrolase family protein [Anaerolineae bacterium]MBT7326799.1 SGNH/GDSL hydrolase family protein [Anaerolineae bacterium]
MKIQPQSKFVMIGDSITDCGRNYDPSYSEEILGDGYVRFVFDHLQSTYLELEIEIVNKGVSGDTVRNLKKRWQRDVLNLNPDWLSIMIGINDVWQQVNDWLPADHWVLIEEYEQTLDELVAIVAPSLKGLILMTPYVLELDKMDEMRMKMDRYGDVVREIAKKYGAIFVDTQTVFDEALKEMDAQELSDDRIHMNAKGHRILAEAFIKAIE